jgi:hypothetical protein
MNKYLLFLAIFSSSVFAVEPFTLSFDELSKKLGYSNYTENEKLSTDQSWSISAYTFNEEVDYQDINGFLRSGTDYELYNQSIASVTKLINDLNSSFLLYPTLPQGLTVFRGTRLSYRGNKCFEKGEVISNKSFLSTTLSNRVADHFAFIEGSGMGAVLSLVINSKKQKAILISENNEHEVLLPSGTKFIIIRSTLINDQCRAFAEVVE